LLPVCTQRRNYCSKQKEHLCEAGFSEVTATKKYHEADWTRNILLLSAITARWEQLVVEKKAKGCH